MSGHVWLDLSMLAVSIFNMVILLWLALTVLFNADRRNAGVWLMGGGLLVGAAFFISHSVIVGQAFAMHPATVNVWWRVGWFPVMVAPFAWYVAVLWYGGFWSEYGAALVQRQRAWLWLLALWLVVLIGVLVAANPIPGLGQLVPAAFDAVVDGPVVDGPAGDGVAATFDVRALPRVLLAFPLWVVVCIVLSIDVLRHPAQTNDLNTTWARQRARPWLLAAAATLLAVSLTVVTFIIHALMESSAIGGSGRGSPSGMPLATVAIYDLVVALLIAAAVLLVGQAVVVHEVFSGRVLPRRSLVRHWRTAILLAAGFGMIVAGSVGAALRPIYGLLGAALLVTFFYALYGQRALREREQLMARLRPFVANEGSSAPPLQGGTTAEALLGALCCEVLDTTHAQLIPMGSMATLAGPAIVFPAQDASRVPPTLPGLDKDADGMRPLDPVQFAPYRWVIALWGEWGLSGVLLVGEKQDGGLYSQEEMEIAQATGERMLQRLAREQMLQRLMEQQRKRTVEQRVMDLRTRRTLHDEVLPALHLAVLQLKGGTQEKSVDEALITLAETHRQVAELLTATQPAPSLAPDPCKLVETLRRMVEAEFAHHFAAVRWHGDTAKSGMGDEEIRVDALTGEVLVGAVREVLRNAALHGRGGTHRRLHIDITVCAGEDEFALAIRDDGVGMDGRQGAAVPQGSGNGLALHSTLLAMIGGYLAVESPETGGTLVRITVKGHAVADQAVQDQGVGLGSVPVVGGG